MATKPAPRWNPAGKRTNQEKREDSQCKLKKSRMNLAVAVDSWMKKSKKYIYANFDAINTVTLRSDRAIS